MPTLEQIQEKMKKLQVQADTLIAKKAQAAVDQIRKIMLTHGLTTVDIEAKAKARREAKAANGNTPNVKAKVARSLKSATPPKYQILRQVPPGPATVARRRGLRMPRIAPDS